MKKNSILLDFTSLLDVTLIIIFFFVLFSQIDSQKDKERTDNKLQELDAAIQDIEYEKSQVVELKQELEKELEIIADSDERQALDVREIIAFSQGKNIKLIMKEDAGEWSVRVSCDADNIDVGIESEDFGDVVINFMDKLRYGLDDTILCEFIYDGAILGSALPYRKTRAVLMELSEKYSNLFVSETNISKED